MNARIVRTRATAVKPELDLIRKKCLKNVSLVILCTAYLTIFPRLELNKTLSTKKQLPPQTPVVYTMPVFFFGLNINSVKKFETCFAEFKFNKAFPRFVTQAQPK